MPPVLDFPYQIGPTTGWTGLSPIRQFPDARSFLIEFGGNLFTFTGGPVGAGPFFYQCSKSTDGGATWTQLDTAAAPTGTALEPLAAFDGAHTVAVAFLPDPSVQIQLQNFDLATETWGPVYGAGGPGPGANLLGVWVAPDTSVVVAYQIPFDPFFLPVVRFSAGVWGTPFDAAPSLAPAGGLMPVAGAVMAPDGILHFVFQDVNTNLLYYQEILPGDTLGASFAFPSPDVQITGALSPIIAGTSLVIPFSHSFTGIHANEFFDAYIGSPVNSPVWANVGAPGLDPTMYDVQNGDRGDFAAYDPGSGTLYCLVMATDLGTSTQVLRLCSTSTAGFLSGWSAVPVFNFLTDPCPVGFNYAGQTLSYPELTRLSSGDLAAIFLAFGYVSDPTDSAFFMPILFGSSPPVPEVILRGVKRYRASTPCDEMREIPTPPHVRKAV